MKKITIALAGNPNCGKTTIFNALTGSRQTTGNWPGVTVEHKVGSYQHQDTEIEVVDLPGIYSFSAYSLDEKVSREYILKSKPDLVINIVDSTNIERNLYLTMQLLEMKIPIIVVLNMMDIAKQRKIKIELEHLATHLDATVIAMIGHKKSGLEELKDAINEKAVIHKISKTQVLYDSVVEDSIKIIQAQAREIADKEKVDARWLAIKLLELDELAEQMTENAFDDLIEEQSKGIERHTGDETDIVIADGRYGFINGLVHDVVHKDNQMRKTVSDAIDKFVLNRMLGIPIFVGVMYLVFMLTINVGSPFIDFFDGFAGTIFVDGFRNLLTLIHFPEWIVTLLANGIGGGIQTVATFIPPIFFMFLSLSILEDSGYMSRAAFVMDRFMRFIGLPGKAFIPMLVGFGCNVPAIMATRTLENNRDRILTILINPFMSCGARLPVYVLFATIFFPYKGGMIIFSLYLIGILLAIITGLLFKKTILSGETSTFVMELPPYHIPTFNGIMMHTWQKLKGFLWRAGKVIIIVVVILSFLNSIGTDGSFGNDDSSNSILSSLGKAITPIFIPMGISRDNWPATVGLFTGIFAKEAIVGTLDAIYTGMDEKEDDTADEPFNFWKGIGDSFKAIPEGFEGLKESAADPMGLSVDLSDTEKTIEDLEVKDKTMGKMVELFGGKNNVFAYLLFILIYVPCVAAIAAIYRETNLRWAIFSVIYLTALAWIIATLFYQTSMIAITPSISLMWIIILLGIVFAGYQGLRMAAKTIKVQA
ncbi:MAG: Fe(2+) transporter permease subunit FeoB [Candidatus Cloacimonetes bacterium]|nr:Fe(2+) transporter permease subunit FeoB [Candidatus Cloacimonadota bacterium]